MYSTHTNGAVFEQMLSFCVVRDYIPFVNNCFPIYALAVITINRFLIIQYPRINLFKTRSWAIISAINGWFFSILICVPQLIVGFQVDIT